jgi:hypothetical protein
MASCYVAWHVRGFSCLMGRFAGCPVRSAVQSQGILKWDESEPSGQRHRADTPEPCLARMEALLGHLSVTRKDRQKSSKSGAEGDEDIMEAKTFLRKLSCSR